MAETETEGAHGLPRDTYIITDELQQVLHGMGLTDAKKPIKSRSALRYDHRVIARVNKEKENAERQKINTTTGTVNVSGVSHRR